MKVVTQGVLLCIFSQCLFGILYLFSIWLQPLSGTDVFAWRMLTMIFGLLLILFPTIGSYHDNFRKKLDALGFIFTGDIRCGKSILALYVGTAEW